MEYISTRGYKSDIKSAKAIKMGIAPDGGLFVPESLVLIDYYKYVDMDYKERAYEIFNKYLTDFTKEELTDCIDKAYGREKFDTSDVAKVRTLSENMHVLELYHGPTCAFKDMALQILPHFMQVAIRKTGEEKNILILVATSGDTGKAALEGFKNVKGTKIVVFFPKEGVSQIQKYQMITQEGDNVKVASVTGNFDDAQSGLKKVFVDKGLRDIVDSKGYEFSSANSINWGRLLPQIVYYVSAYADLVQSEKIEDGEKINIVVPTGNFGNILAAFYAKKMNLPINKLICASNSNNVLTDFIQTGVYDKNRKFINTISPSMDILISSNLERLLFELTNKDTNLITKWMDQLDKTGTYELDKKTREKVQDLFFAGSCSDDETYKAIWNIYSEYGYLIDTHTAVGIEVYDKYVINSQDFSTKTIVASTASPYKFPQSVAAAIMGEDKISGKTDFEVLEMLSKETNIPIPKNLRNLNSKEIIHKDVCKKNKISKYMHNYINNNL